MKLEDLFIAEDASVLESMKQLDVTGQRILFVAPEGRLRAVLTDGDLRKFLLRGGRLGDPVRLAANYTPKHLPVADRGRAREILEQYSIDALPLLDRDGTIADVVFATGLDVDNRKKAGILYDYLDSSKFYIANIDRDSRSIMNVTYHCPTKELDAKFVAESIERGFQNLKGYRSVGGIRASIYNAMPVEGVEALVDFMAKFERENG